MELVRTLLAFLAPLWPVVRGAATEHPGVMPDDLGGGDVPCYRARARFRDENLADVCGWEVSRWIEANKGRPFFLYFASLDIRPGPRSITGGNLRLECRFKD